MNAHEIQVACYAYALGVISALAFCAWYEVSKLKKEVEKRERIRAAERSAEVWRKFMGAPKK